MEPTTASKMDMFEKFLEGIDSSYKDNGRCFWLMLRKETYQSDTDIIRDKAKKLGIDVEICEPQQSLLTLDKTYCLEIRRK